jgi:diguanylate cyclase (GGDEF)-like protein
MAAVAVGGQRRGVNASWGVGAVVAAGSVGVALGGLLGGLRRRVLARRLATARRVAVVDPLTGALNRAGWTAQAIEKVRHDETVVVGLLDLDGFKAVNDTHGHTTGDLALTAVVRRLVELTGARSVGRLGGDEFAVALSTGLSSTSLAGLFTAMTAPLPVPVPGVGVVSVRSSLGLARVPSVGVPARGLSTGLARADTAMYRAKHNGGGWAWWDPTVDPDPRVVVGPVARRRVHGPATVATGVA